MLGSISVGTVVAFILLVRELYFPINRISEMNTVLHNSLAAIDRRRAAIPSGAKSGK